MICLYVCIYQAGDVSQYQTGDVTTETRARQSAVRRRRRPDLTGPVRRPATVTQPSSSEAERAGPTSTFREPITVHRGIATCYTPRDRGRRVTTPPSHRASATGAAAVWYGNRALGEKTCDVVFFDGLVTSYLGSYFLDLYTIYDYV